MAKTCGHCGARNAPEADYCIQCMGSFGPLTLPKPPMRLRGAPQTPGVPPAAGAIPPPPPGSSPTSPATLAQTMQAPADPAGTTSLPSDEEIAALLSGTTDPGLPAVEPVFTLTDEEVRQGKASLNDEGIGIVNGKPIWQCRQCEHLQPMTNFVCAKCATRFGAEKADPVAAADYKRMEMMFPGYGFFQSGHLFSAITRIAIVASWIVTAIFVGFQRPLVALPLLIGVGVLWALGPHDIEQVLLGHEPRLNGRGLLILITLVLLAFIFVGAAEFYLGTSGLTQ